MADIVLVRHGQSVWNVEGRVQGTAHEPPLTNRGRVQSGRAARLIAALRPDLVLCSDQVRAAQTAAIIAAEVGLPVRTDPRLREQDVGQLTGMLTQDAIAAWGHLPMNDPDLAHGDTGESARDVAARMLQIIKEYEATDGTVVMVSHGAAIQIALAAVLGEDLGAMTWRQLPNCAVIRIRNGTIETIEEKTMNLIALREPIARPSDEARNAALERLHGLAKPVGALGQLEDLAAWLAAVQAKCPPAAPNNVRAVIFAGDHGVTKSGVSAYPAEVTAAMVDGFVAGVAGVSVLAKQHDVHVRVFDISVDADLSAIPQQVTQYKVCRGSGSIDTEDAISTEQLHAALQAGAAIARDEIDAGADLLIAGDMGIGNTTVAASLIAASLGLDGSEVAGRGTGIDQSQLEHKVRVIDQALHRVGSRAEDPLERLSALGSADMAAAVGFIITAARAGVPLLLDGVIAVAEAVVANDIAPGTLAWCAAGHRSPEPAQSLALEKLGLTPILDLGMRLGEGSGAVAAVPLVRSAALILSNMALLSDLVPGN